MNDILIAWYSVGKLVVCVGHSVNVPLVCVLEVIIFFLLSWLGALLGRLLGRHGYVRPSGFRSFIIGTLAGLFFGLVGLGIGLIASIFLSSAAIWILAATGAVFGFVIGCVVGYD